MLITREADYAIRMMLEVASQPSGRPRTTVDVSKERLVPRPFVRKIVGRLTAAGLLRTRRGNHGGLMLARPADEITLLSIIDATQSPITVNRCVLNPQICPLQPTCPVHEVCRTAREQLVDLFGSVRLTDLLKRSAELKANAAVGAA
ncbi:MAG: Rrf2 family transcriptional regulator [Chloroflexi bacterium]|nr:Rrf2 family transcriptional regulator [Chloroflexota bacterium]